jgi:hypothetical protein
VGNFDWFDAADENARQVRRIAAGSTAISLVEQAVRGPHKRTPKVKVRCGGHESGASLRLSVADGAVRLAWEPGSPVFVFGLKDTTDGAPVRLTCGGCGRVTSKRPQDILLLAISGVGKWLENPSRVQPALQWNQNIRSK